MSCLIEDPGLFGNLSAYENLKAKCLCYGIKGDSRSIELNMDLNPMITGCFIELFSDLDEDALINSLKEYLEHNTL